MDKDLYNQFYAFVDGFLNSIVQETKHIIEKDSQYKFATSTKERIKILKKHKVEYANHTFNFMDAKGVKYEGNGKYSIVESEFMELINTNRINLIDTRYGKFYNELDDERVLPLKSPFQVISVMTYCLQLQLVNEMIDELKNGVTAEYFDPVFKDAPSEQFFLKCFDEWLKDKKKPLRPISYVFFKMWYKTNEDKGLEYRIVESQLKFAQYWNEKIPHNYKIPIDGSSAKLKTLTDIPNQEGYETNLNRILSMMPQDIKTGD